MLTAWGGDWENMKFSDPITNLPSAIRTNSIATLPKVSVENTGTLFALSTSSPRVIDYRTARKCESSIYHRAR